MSNEATSNKTDGSTFCEHAILPFIEPKGGPSKLTKDNSATLELLVNIAVATSAKVKTNVRKISGTEAPWETLQWVNGPLPHVFPDMGLTTGAAQRAALNTVTSGNTHIIVVCCTHAQSTMHLELAIMANPDPSHTNHVAVLGRGLDIDTHLPPAMVMVGMYEIIEAMLPRRALAKVHRHL
jgi:hypothetical protein